MTRSNAIFRRHVLPVPRARVALDMLALYALLGAGAMSCERDKPAAAGEPDKAPPPSAAAMTVPAAHAAREGLSITFSLRAPDGGEVRAGRDLEAVFTITDEKTGAPATRLRPFAWMTRRLGKTAPDEAACKEQIKRYLGGFLSAQADVDMNSYLLWSLNQEGSISIINPQIAFNRTKLMRLISLPGKPADGAFAPDKRFFYASLPEADQVSVVDAARYNVLASLPVGDGPSRVVPSPDGKHVWVGNDEDGTVSILDARVNRVRKTMSVGPGHHEIAFTDEGRTAWITSRASRLLVAIDAETLEVKHEVELGEGAVSIDASAEARAVYVALGARGQVVIVNAERGEVASRLRLAPGLSTLRFAPGGRFAFALCRGSGTVSVIDASTASVAHTLQGFASPDALTFTDAYAYVRHGADAKVSLIELGALGKEGAPPVVDVAAGQRAPGDVGGAEGTTQLAPMPEGQSALFVNPADKSFYVYVEGMMAPRGTLSNYGRTPSAVSFADRTLRESAPGVYTTGVQVERGGVYDIAALIEEPRAFVCLEQRIEVPVGGDKLDPAERLHFEPLFDTGARFPAREPATLRFRMHDMTSSAPIAPSEISVLVFRDPAGYRFRGAPNPVGEGVYEVTFTPPSSGQYRFLVGAASRGVKLGIIPFITLGVTAPKGGEGAEASEVDAEKGGAR